MAARSPLEELLGTAKKRHLINISLAEFGIAACIAAIACILLLVFGTQILDWYWPALLVLAAIAFGFWRVRGQLWSEYRLAQLIDRRLDLHDSIATAYHFSRTATPQMQGSLAPYQIAEANEIARTADVRHAVPVEFSRSLYVFSALVVIAGSLFAIRYGTLHTLALRAPIAQLHFSPFHRPAPPTHSASTKSVIQERLEQQMQQLGIPLDQQDATAANDPLAQKAASALATPDGKEPMAAAEKGQSINGKDSPEGSESIDGNEPGESSSSGAGSKAGDQQASSETPQSSPGKTPDNPQNGKSGSNQNDNSLANKMRDAVANLLSKLKPSKSENAQNASGQQQGNAASQQMSKNGMQGQGKSNAEGQGSPDQNGNQEGDAADKAAAQARAGEKSSDKPGNQDSKSGVGRSDGDKELRDAEQLAAMGKISEILGKRSAKVEGQMSVEVASGAQQLKTAYSGKRSQHADNGAEIDRDEVPLIYQPYVQRYFEEVHKSSKTPKAAAKVRSQQPVVQTEPTGH